MPRATAPPLAMKPDSIVLAMYHGNQINTSLWHDSSSGSAESNRPCMATHVSQLQEPLSATLKFSLEEPHGSGGLYEEPRLLSHLSEQDLDASTPYWRLFFLSMPKLIILRSAFMGVLHLARGIKTKQLLKTRKMRARTPQFAGM